MKNSKISNGLCQDLIIEIFTRLPVRSLLRFRSVSKSLCSCIGSPDFIRLHTLRSPEKLMIVHLLKYGVDYRSRIYTLHSESQLSSSPNTNVPAADYPFIGFEILGSSNGIICLFQTENGINLWNPSTRRKLTVQDRPSWYHTWSPSEGPSYNVFGFGYDPILDDYKILRWTKPDTLKVYSVYTLKTDTWREIRGPATPYSYLYSHQCLFNGTLHWVAVCELVDQSGGSQSVYDIMTFDLRTNVFSAIPFPEHGRGTRQVITVIKGYLAVMSTENGNTWIRVRKEESWSVAFKFKTIEINRVYKVLQLTADGDLLLQSRLIILVYNPETHVESRLEKFRDSRNVELMEKCVEGLGLLHMGTSCK